MSSKTSLTRGFYNLFIHIWFYLWSNMTDRCKRMFVLASLYARLMRVDEDNLEELKELNENLDLSKDPKALRAPTLFSQWVWGNTLPIERIDLDHADRYIMRLVKKTPCWLWYADQDTRKKDLQNLIIYCVYRKSMSAG